MIFVLATLTVKPDRRSAFIRDAEAVIEATRQETGCISYDLCNNISDPDQFVFVERWQSREALGAHFETPHLRHWRDFCADYVSKASLEIIKPDHVES